MSIASDVPPEPRAGTWSPRNPGRVGRWVVAEANYRRAGMAFVHRVFDAEDPARVPRILKILKPWQDSFEREVGTPERQRARFVLEVFALQTLGVAGAPGLVEVIDAALDASAEYPW